MMTRCRLQGGDGEVEMARWEWRGGDWRAGRLCQVGRCWGEGEAAWVEKAGGEGKAAGVEEAGPGRGCKVGGGFRWRSKDGEVEIVRWRWRGVKIAE